MSDDRRVPTGRFRRLAGAAKLGARAGASYLLSRDGGKLSAEKAADVLGSMRGLAAKIGQVASYVDGLIPENQRHAYAAALSGLQSAAARSSPEDIRSLVEQELGAPIERLYAHFEPEPFASASIGQVHRARLHDGRDVAVKVQHPGIDTAVTDDLKNIGVLERLMARIAPGELNSKALFEEIATRLTEELDYTLEARNLQLFRDTIHAGDPHILVPEVVAQLSGRRVLTMERMEGMTLDEAADRPVWERKHYAEVLWRFAYKAILAHGAFNADPHPGNYLFRGDGKVVFLDFGCVQPLTEHTLRYARACHHAARARDEGAFSEHAARLVKAQGGPFEAAFVKHLRGCLEPVFASPYQITSRFVAELFHGMRELQRTALQRDSGLKPVPRDTLLLNRLHFGFFSVLARLEVQADYAGEERRFLRG